MKFLVTDFLKPCNCPCFKVLIITKFLETSVKISIFSFAFIRNQYFQLKMLLEQLLLVVSMVSCGRIVRRNTSNSFRNSMVALGTMNHGHAIVDEAFFYDFMSLSIEFNRENLDEFVRVNLDPTFTGFTNDQFDSLLESWIFGMLSVSY